MFLTRSYLRKESFHRRRKPVNSSFKGISHLSKRAKRHVKLQFWLWRKRQENCILGMYRAKRRVHKNFPFSHPHLSFRTKRNRRITKRFGSSDVTPSTSSIDVASRAREKKGEMCKIKNSLLKPNHCLSVLPVIMDFSAAPKTFNRASADLSQLSHDVNPRANGVVLEQNLTIDLVLDKDKNAEDILSSKIPSSHHFNISPEKLAMNVQEFLNDFHRKYGSFIPLEKSDILEHLEEKFNRDFKDQEIIILEITIEQMAKLVKTLPSFQVVYKKHTLTLDDFSTLANENWLNDQVINMYGELIMESAHCKVHFLNSFFHRQLMTKGYEGVKRWTKRVDLFSKNLLLVPVHLEVHWCLVTADLVKKRVCLYDSQGTDLQKVARNILRYLLNEAKEKKQTAFENGWTVAFDEEIPQQTNENDCGVFVLEYSRCLALSKPLAFSQKDIPKIRKRIYKELCECKLHEKATFTNNLV